MRAVIAMVVLSIAATAHAQRCPAPAWAPELAQVSAAARLEFLAQRFDREVHSLDLWSWSWGGAYATAMTAQLVAIPLVHGDARTDLAAGAISAGVGSASLLLLPLRITRPLVRVRARWNQPDRCALLAEAEATLVETAAIERLSSGWIPHVGNVVVNAALALILGWGFGHWTSAAISAGVGLAVGEANVLTEPHHLPAALDDYRKLATAEAAPAISWSFAPMAGGGVIGLRFEVSL